MADTSYSFRLAREADRAAIIDFVNTHWETRHPLVNLPEFFEYYYVPGNGRLNFVLAEQAGRLVALAGFVPANIKIKPDIWVSLWVADKTATGSGLELMAEIPRLTGCRVMACNNIRPETRPFYGFLGYTTGQLNHFYRLVANGNYRLARLKYYPELPTGGNAQLVPYRDADALDASGFIPPENAVPYKDLWYIKRRYYGFPHQKYRVFGVLMPAEKRPQALLVARVIQWQDMAVFRIVDFIGDPALMPECGGALDGILPHYRVEYADLYCAGVDPALLQGMGFSLREEGDENIIPHYITPPLYQNNDFYYFTNQPQHFTLFKADGDQDRPNIPVP